MSDRSPNDREPANSVLRLERSKLWQRLFYRRPPAVSHLREHDTKGEANLPTRGAPQGLSVIQQSYRVIALRRCRHPELPYPIDEENPFTRLTISDDAKRSISRRRAS